MTSFICDEEISRMGDEFSEDIVELKTQISKLSVENEKYRQQLHDLHRKLETNSTMQSELLELNEALEQSLREHEAGLNRRIHEIEDKQLGQRKLLQERLEETENELAMKSKENQDLRETMKANNEKLLAMSQAEHSVVGEGNLEIFQSEIERLTELLEQETECRKYLEDATESAQSESKELKEILAATKGQLAERDRVLEATREELSCYRMELESLKTTPVSETCKGNSLFAEVEDRRKMTLEQMTAMRNSYTEAKRSFQAKEAEIKALKAERAMLLRKWEDDTVEKIQQDATLCDKYKMRIGELERQLKEEHKKQKQIAKNQQTPDNNFTFMQSLVDAKIKEVEELRAKIENDSIKALLEEETKHKIGKQLRYWRYRAMSGEAQLLSIKNRLESDPSSSNVDILSTLESCLNSKHNESSTDSEKLISDESSYRETTIANQTIVTLESLMNIPKPLNAWPMNATSTTAQDMDVTNCVIGQTTAEGVNPDITKTIPTSLATIDDFSQNAKSIVVVKTEPQETCEHTEKHSTAKSLKENSENDVKFNSNDKTVAPILKSVIGDRNSQRNTNARIFMGKTCEKDRKTLRFTDDTIDPPGNPLKKKISEKPQYPIVFISCNKSKV